MMDDKGPISPYFSGEPSDEEDEPQADLLSEEEDAAILMHRDAHFGGLFSVMLDYYAREGKGALPDFSIARIEYLDHVERQIGDNLAARLLSASQAESVAKARKAYKKLRSLFEKNDRSAETLRLIADLILAESEEPVDQIAALSAKGKEAIPSLIELLLSPDYHDPLFPGYGQAPALAARCLGEIGDPSAVVPLFESLEMGDFETDESVLQALRKLKAHTWPFLLRVLKSRPVTVDNERAAMVMAALAETEEDAKTALAELLRLDASGYFRIAAYLIAACAYLQDPQDRRSLIDFGERPGLSTELRQEVAYLAKSWR